MLPGTGRAIRALEAFGGVDAVVDAIHDGKTLTQIAEMATVSPGRLVSWIGGDSERSARIHEARRAMAFYWEERAESVLQGVEDQIGLGRARELAHHYRWRASKIAPAEYADRTGTMGKGGELVDPTKLTVEDTRAPIDTLMSKAAAKAETEE